MNNSIIWPSKPKWTRDTLVGELSRVLHGRAQEAYLVGSYARGEADDESDIDVILVVDTGEPWPERATAFADLSSLFGAIDIVVYTPREWQELLVSPTPFIAHAQRTWVRVK